MPNADKTFSGMIGGDEGLAPDADQEVIGNDQALALRGEDGADAPMVGASFGDGTNFGSEDITFPSLKLGQAQTPEVQDDGEHFKQGHWILTGGLKSYETLMVIPLQSAKVRHLYYADDGGPLAGRLKCSSGDGVTGTGDPGGSCNGCPFSVWTERPGQKTNAPPACNLGYQYLFAVFNPDDPESCDLGMWVARKTAMTAAKNINMFMMTKRAGNFGIQLSAVRKDGTRGKYYVPVARLVRPTPEQFAMARQFLPGAA